VLVKANTAFSIAFFAKVFFGYLNAWKILNDITGCGRTRRIQVYIMIRIQAVGQMFHKPMAQKSLE
jgi:hypothetical protein